MGSQNVIVGDAIADKPTRTIDLPKPYPHGIAVHDGLDRLIFKLMFSLTRFWGRGDNLKKYWLNQKANHANFLARKFTTKIEGEEVPYTVSENAGVCSSCAEFFNVVSDTSRKLVRSCPGSVIFGGAERNIYYDIKPAKKHLIEIERRERCRQ